MQQAARRQLTAQERAVLRDQVRGAITRMATPHASARVDAPAAPHLAPAPTPAAFAQTGSAIVPVAVGQTNPDLLPLSAPAGGKSGVD